MSIDPSANDYSMWGDLTFLSAGSLDPDVMQELIHIISHQIALYNSAQRPHIAEAMDLSLLDYSALELIIGFQKLTTGQIARLTGLSSGGTTTLLTRLETAGYIRRARHPRDRRVIIVQPITSRCEAMLAITQKDVKEALNSTICHHTFHIQPAYELLKHCIQHMRQKAEVWLENGHDMEHAPRSP